MCNDTTVIDWNVAYITKDEGNNAMSTSAVYLDDIKWQIKA